MILIKIHRFGRSMNDQNPPLPREIEHRRHFVRQRVHPLAGGVAPVTVPHVANDQGSPGNRQQVVKRYTLLFAASSEGLCPAANGKMHVRTARRHGEYAKATEKPEKIFSHFAS